LSGGSGVWLVEHQHSDGPGRSFCLVSLALSRDRLVFKSQNASEGFMATAQETTIVNQLREAGTFSISFR
jgi:hypothetical protein